MMLGEVSPGGVGVGLNGLLIMVILSVFIAGLMVGRTPEYLGKKIQATEMKLVMLYVLAMPMALLGFAAASVLIAAHWRRRTTLGPTGSRRSSTPSRPGRTTTGRRSPVSPRRPGGTTPRWGWRC